MGVHLVIASLSGKPRVYVERSAATRADGNWAVAIEVPADAPSGDYYVHAGCRDVVRPLGCRGGPGALAAADQDLGRRRRSILMLRRTRPPPHTGDAAPPSPKCPEIWELSFLRPAPALAGSSSARWRWSRPEAVLPFGGQPV